MPAIKTLISVLDTGIENITKRGDNIPVTGLERTLKRHGVKDQEIEASGILNIANELAAKRNKVSRQGNLVVTPEDLKEAVAKRTDVFKEETQVIPKLDDQGMYNTQTLEERDILIEAEQEAIIDKLPPVYLPKEEIARREEFLLDRIELEPDEAIRESHERQLEELHNYIADPDSPRQWDTVLNDPWIDQIPLVPDQAGWHHRIRQIAEDNLIERGHIPLDEHIGLGEDSLYVYVSPKDVDKNTYRVTIVEHPALSGKYASDQVSARLGVKTPGLVESKYFRDIEIDADIVESWHIRGDRTKDTVFGGKVAERIFEIQSSSRTNQAWVRLQEKKLGKKKNEYLLKRLKEENIREPDTQTYRVHSGSANLVDDLISAGMMREGDLIPTKLSWVDTVKYDYHEAMFRELHKKRKFFSRPMIDSIDNILGDYFRQDGPEGLDNAIRVFKTKYQQKKGFIPRIKISHNPDLIYDDYPRYIGGSLESEAAAAHSFGLPDELPIFEFIKKEQIEKAYSRSIASQQYSVLGNKEIENLNKHLSVMNAMMQDDDFKKLIDLQNQIADINIESDKVYTIIQETQKKFPVAERLEKLEPDTSIWKNAVYQELSRAKEKGIKEVQFLIEPGPADNMAWSETVGEELYGRIIPQVIMNAARKIDAKIAWKNSSAGSKYLVVGLPAAGFTLPLYAEENKEESFMATAKSLGLSEEEAREYLEERTVDDLE